MDQLKIYNPQCTHNLAYSNEVPLFRINISHMLLDYIDLFLKTDNSIKIVILKRNRENTIKSIYNRYFLNEKHYNHDNNSICNFGLDLILMN